jgi:hypothetical protein
LWQSYGTVRESISSLEVTSLEEVEMTNVFICARSTDRLSWNLGHFFLSCHASPPVCSSSMNPCAFRARQTVGECFLCAALRCEEPEESQSAWSFDFLPTAVTQASSQLWCIFVLPSLRVRSLKKSWVWGLVHECIAFSFQTASMSPARLSIGGRVTTYFVYGNLHWGSPLTPDPLWFQVWPYLWFIEWEIWFGSSLVSCLAVPQRCIALRRTNFVYGVKLRSDLKILFRSRRLSQTFSWYPTHAELRFLLFLSIAFSLAVRGVWVSSVVSCGRVAQYHNTSVNLEDVWSHNSFQTIRQALSNSFPTLI